MADIKYTTVVEAEQVTDEILEAAQSIYDGWYADRKTVDWDDFLNRLDDTPLDDGSRLALGDSMVSPAIKKIKAHINHYRKL